MDVVQVVPTENNFHLCSYFMNVGLAIFEEDVLPNLDKVINGQPFEEDGDGFISFLTIGPEVSSFDSTNKAAGIELIATRDIRDIPVLWIDWIYKNNLEKYY